MAQVSFSYTSSQACENQNVTFSAMPDSGKSYYWDFGDTGVTVINVLGSNLVNNSFANAGTINVQLVVTYNSGAKDSVTQAVIINPTPSAAIGVNVEGAGSLTSFTDLSSIGIGSIDSWYWEFGDGNTSGQKNPTNRYEMAGSYEVSLTTVSNNYCNDMAMLTLVIAEPSVVVSTEIEVASNVLTPNNDGYNDVLDFGLTGCEVTIYNRWNDQVYTSSSYNNDWSDSGLDGGAYYYKIKCPSGVKKMGIINIIK